MSILISWQMSILISWQMSVLISWHMSVLISWQMSVLVYRHMSVLISWERSVLIYWQMSVLISWQMSVLISWQMSVLISWQMSVGLLMSWLKSIPKQLVSRTDEMIKVCHSSHILQNRQPFSTTIWYIFFITSTFGSTCLTLGTKLVNVEVLDTLGRVLAGGKLCSFSSKCTSSDISPLYIYASKYILVSLF